MNFGKLLAQFYLVLTDHSSTRFMLVPAHYFWSQSSKLSCSESILFWIRAKPDSLYIDLQKPYNVLFKTVVHLEYMI